MAAVRILVCVLVQQLVAISPAKAVPLLDGATVTTLNFHGSAPDTTVAIGPMAAAVGPGVELLDWQGQWDIDFSDVRIVITASRDSHFSYFEVLRFSDALGAIPAFRSVVVAPETDWMGFDSSRIAFGDDHIDVNLTSLPGVSGQRIALTLLAIPEPGAAGLVLLGIAMITGARRARAGWAQLTRSAFEVA